MCLFIGENYSIKFFFFRLKCKMVETSNLLSMNFSRKYRVSSRYFIVGVKIAGCWHILTGLMVSPLTHCTVHECCTCKLQQNCKLHNSVDVIHRAVKLWYDEVYLTISLPRSHSFSNSSNCLPYNSHDVTWGSENLVLDQPIIF